MALRPVAIPLHERTQGAPVVDLLGHESSLIGFCFDRGNHV